MQKLGYGEHAKRRARCPFHRPDRKPSFSVFEIDGNWFWKCHAGCGEGDEINFIEKALSLSNGDAIPKYGELAGFPIQRPKFHVSLVHPVSPVSEGQGCREKALKLLAAENACIK